MSISKKILIAILALNFSALASISTRADDHGHWRGRNPGWRAGRWIHDRHGGRLGWWWVVGDAWHYYALPHSFAAVAPAPVVVQQAPPVVVEQVPPAVVPAPVAQAPAAPVLYYCKATGTHYPETMTCPGGWSTHTADVPPEP